MLGLIIFGTKGVESIQTSGRFYCPDCGPESRFKLKSLRRYFTLYFIPIFPIGGVESTYVECGGCQASYRKSILKYDPQEEQENAERAEAEFQKAMRRVMVDIMMADDIIDDQEIDTLETIYETVSEKPLPRELLEAEMRRFDSEGSSTTITFLQNCRSLLNLEGRKMVLRGGLAVAGSDGEYHPDEEAMIKSYAKALKVSPKMLRTLTAEIFESD